MQTRVIEDPKSDIVLQVHPALSEERVAEMCEGQLRHPTQKLNQHPRNSCHFDGSV